MSTVARAGMRRWQPAARLGVLAVATIGMVAATSVPAMAVTAQPGTYLGKGFDACTAPPSSTMQAWLASPYRSIGIYIGGGARACSQPQLTANWVSAQASAGWHLVPIYVGRQAPCTTFAYRMSSNPTTARSQGRSDANDAATVAAPLGLGANTVIFSDVEGYNSSDATCRTAVLSYLTGWTERLHEQDYLSGVYSSVSSGIKNLGEVYRSASYARPDQIWFAWWNGLANTDTASYVPAAYWSNHERMHQYQGGHNETYGGKTINIDTNQVDVAPPVNRNFTSYPTVRNGDRGAQVSAVQYLLNEDGRNAGPVDGVFGAQTQNAIEAFQAANGLTTDGVVGPHTWTALLSAGWRPTLASGSTGHEVRRLQRTLTAALGRTVTINGSFGTATVTAVRDYQSSRGLVVDGIVGPATWGSLQSGG
jgi:peptidoglycan hydrolase-like protein with peptidoglycan-binding domain